jgi:hypothetical protein
MEFIKNNKSSIDVGGLYDLIINSRKKETKVFRRWITRGVLPSINKYVSFSIEEKYGCFYEENDLFKYSDNNACYLAYVGIHNDESFFKFGISYDYHRK